MLSWFFFQTAYVAFYACAGQFAAFLHFQIAYVAFYRGKWPYR